MPRPRASAAQQARAYELRNDGLGATAIFEKLCEEFEDPGQCQDRQYLVSGLQTSDRGAHQSGRPV